jgi:hypothetical protein
MGLFPFGTQMDEAHVSIVRGMNLHVSVSLHCGQIGSTAGHRTTTRAARTEAIRI